MKRRSNAIHIEPKQLAPQMTPEQLQTLLASPECAALVAALADAVRAIVAQQSQRAA